MLATDNDNPNTSPGQSPKPRYHGAEDRGHRDLRHGTGYGDAPNFKQVADREMQTHAEHQQNDADLCELSSQAGVSNVAGCEGSNGDARDEIAQNGRQPQPRGDQPEDKSQPESSGNSSNQRGFMRHGA